MKHNTPCKVASLKENSLSLSEIEKEGCNTNKCWSDMRTKYVTTTCNDFPLS